MKSSSTITNDDLGVAAAEVCVDHDPTSGHADDHNLVALESADESTVKSMHASEASGSPEASDTTSAIQHESITTSKLINKRLIAGVCLLALAIAAAVSVAVPLSTRDKSDSDNDAIDNSIVEFTGDISQFISTTNSSKHSNSNNANNEYMARQSTFGSSSCPPGEGLWNLRLVTDNYPWETKWELIQEVIETTTTTNIDEEYNVNNFEVEEEWIATTTNIKRNNITIASGPPPNTNYARLTNYTGNMCLPNGKYFMKWFDSNNDGICCEYGNGSWVVHVDGVKILEHDPKNDDFMERAFEFRIGVDGDDNNNNDGAGGGDDSTNNRITGTYLGRRFPSAHIELSDGTIYQLINLPPDFEYKGFVSGITRISVSADTEFFLNGTADMKGEAPRLLGVGGGGGGNGRRDLKFTDEEDVIDAATAIESNKEGGKKNYIDTERKKEGRQLADYFGAKSIIVVRVIATDGASTLNETDLSNGVFGNDGADIANLASQMKACSYGQLTFVQAEDRVGNYSSNQDGEVNLSNGVVTITLQNTSITQGEATMRNAITQQLNAVFNVKHPRQLADFAMYCLASNTFKSGIAYAYMNSWLSVYNDEWCGRISIQMHELGHSLNFGHSNEDGQTYFDESGYMGFSYPNDDVPLMCYNAAKSWQTGWYQDKEVAININTTTTCFNGTLRGIADYPIATTVLLKIENGSGTDYYINYNAKKGINAGTQDGGNQVTIVSRPDGLIRDSYAESELVAKLGSGGTYSLMGYHVSAGPIDVKEGAAQVVVLPNGTDVCISN